MRRLRLDEAGSVPLVLDWLDTLSGPTHTWRLVPAMFTRCDARRASRGGSQGERARKERLSLYCPHRCLYGGSTDSYCTYDYVCKYQRHEWKRSKPIAMPTGHKCERYRNDYKTRRVLSMWVKWYLLAFEQGGMLEATATARNSGEWEPVWAITASMWPGLDLPTRVTRANEGLATWIAAGADDDLGVTA